MFEPRYIAQNYLTDATEAWSVKFPVPEADLGTYLETLY